MAFVPAALAAIGGGSAAAGAMVAATAAATAYTAVQTQKAAKNAMGSGGPVEKPPTPQGTKQADRSSIAANNAAAAMAGGALSGNSGTFLTGPGGVDTASLNLGKNTLLGQ